MWNLETSTAEETRALGAALAAALDGPAVVALIGDLGAGKTCLAQGAGEALALDAEVVSPTFTLMAEYEGAIPMLHADAYRLGPGEAEGIGLEETIEDWDGLTLVEWADRVGDCLPVDHLRVELHHTAGGRRVVVTAHGPHHQALADRWRRRWEREHG